MAQPPRPSTTRKHTARPRAVLALLLPWLACAHPPQSPDAWTLPPAPETGGLTVRLVFGPEADLDLHVTDPLQETVYFANTPSVSGGRLEADVGCDAPGPRLEVIRFERPPPGIYRVGVDFPVRCRRVGEPVPFVLEIFADGVRHERRGSLAFGRFEPIAYEVAVGAPRLAP